MLEARKDNKVYRIIEEQKERYLKEGFDIYEDGKVIEYTPKKVIKYSDHLKIVSKNEKEIIALKEQLSNTQNVVAENVLNLLKQYAKEKNIDIGACTTAKGILDKILEVEKE